jgi:hypothetical protein
MSAAMIARDRQDTGKAGRFGVAIAAAPIVVIGIALVGSYSPSYAQTHPQQAEQKKASAARPSGSPSGSSTRAVETGEGSSLDPLDRRYADYGRSLQDAVYDPSPDVSNLLSKFDLEKFRERAVGTLGNVSSDKPLQGQFWADADNEIKGVDGLFQQIRDNVRHGGSYQFLGAFEKEYAAPNRPNGGMRIAAVFRMIKPDGGGINYHDYVLHFDRTHGSVVAVDVYSYLYGEDLSESLHRDFLSKDDYQFELDQRHPDHAYWSSRLLVRAMLDAYKSGMTLDARKFYNKLPPSVQMDQAILIAQLHSALDNDDKDEYQRVYATFNANYRYVNSSRSFPFPDMQAPARELTGIDGFLFLKVYDKAHECVEHLQRVVGRDDPYLGVITAGIYLAEGSIEKARSHAIAALNEAAHSQHGGGPTAKRDAFWKLMEATAVYSANAPSEQKERRFEDTARVLRDNNIDKSMIKNLSSFPQFQEFTHSGAFAGLFSSPTQPTHAAPQPSATEGSSPRGRP